MEFSWPYQTHNPRKMVVPFCWLITNHLPYVLLEWIFFYAKKGVLAKKGDYIAYNHVLQPKDGTLVTQFWIHES
jgi:hypothetical protein